MCPSTRVLKVDMTTASAHELRCQKPFMFMLAAMLAAMFCNITAFLGSRAGNAASWLPPAACLLPLAAT